MLETIFGALNDVLVSFCKLFIAIFDGVLEMSGDNFVSMFPIFATGYGIFQSIAVGIVILIAGYNVFKFCFGPLAAVKESPTSVLFRAICALALIFMGGHIFENMITLAKVPYMAFRALGTGGMSSIQDKLSSLCDGFLTSLLGSVMVGGLSLLVEIILSIVLLVMIFKSLFRLALEIVERLVLVSVLTFTSPLACSTMASASTTTIFSRYLNMFFGQLLLMSLSIWSYNLALSGIVSLAGAVTAIEVVARIFAVLAVCKIGSRMDTFLQQLGVGVGVTGGGLADEAIGVAAGIGHAVHNVLSNVRASTGGGEDGTGHRSDSILGGYRNSDGSISPDIGVGGGLLGAGLTAVRAGYHAARDGGSIGDVAHAAKQGAQIGFGLGDDDTSMVTGRTASNAIQRFLQSRREAMESSTQAAYGRAVMSGDRKSASLNPTAQNRGLKLSSKGVLQSNDPVTAGRFIAANMGEEAAQNIVTSTARHGDPTISEQALFGTHNDLSCTRATEVSPIDFDQAGSDMVSATFGDAFASLERREADGEPLSQEERNLAEVGALTRSTMSGDASHGWLTQFQAHDIDSPDGGREVSANIRDDNGRLMGSMTALDQKGYNQLSEADKQGFVPITSATGATYYMRASGITMDERGVPQASRYGATTPLPNTTAPQTAPSGQEQGRTQGQGGAPGQGQVQTQGGTLGQGQGQVQTQGGALGQGQAVPGSPLASKGQGNVNVQGAAVQGAVQNQTTQVNAGSSQVVGGVTVNKQDIAQPLAAGMGGSSPAINGFGKNVPEGVPFERKIAGGGIDTSAAWREGGVEVGADSQGRDIIKGEDSLNAGAAINYALASSRTDEQRLGEQTIHSPDVSKDTMQQALFNPEAGGVGPGHDASVAHMVHSTLGADTIGSALGKAGADIPGGSAPSPEDASHFARALQAAGGTATPEIGYECKNLSADKGVVSCDYTTPSGSYQVKIAEQGGFPTPDTTPAGGGSAPAPTPTISFSTANGTAYEMSVQQQFMDKPKTQPINPTEVFDPADDDGRYGGRGKKKKR